MDGTGQPYIINLPFWQCSIPFSVDDITNSMHEKDFLDVKPAEELLENQAFQFLQD
jgi:hypothetical protein